MRYVLVDPRSSGLTARIGTIVAYAAAGTFTRLYKWGSGDTQWCTIPEGGAARPVTADPRQSPGLAAPVGDSVMFVTGGVGTVLHKVGTHPLEWMEAASSGAGDGGGGPHTHEVADVSGLGAALSGKADASHSHSYAAVSHGHAIGDTTGLETALNAKADTGHAHTIANVTGLQSALDGKQATGSYASASHNHDAAYAAVSHTHAIANVTGLQAALDGKSDTNHTHAGGGSYSRPWFSSICGAYADGDPGWLLQAMQRAGNVAPTPTNIGTTVARISFFRLPADLVLNKIRFYGVGATTSIFRCAIYSYAATCTRVTAELPFTTVANAWGAAGAALNVTLTKDALYFIAVSVNTTGTIAGPAAFGGTLAATTGQIATAPQSLPGNLDMDAGKLGGYQAQMPVTAGALPATIASSSLAAQGAWVGGMPALFLDNNNA